MTKELL